LAARPNVRLIASLRGEFKPRRAQIAGMVSYSAECAMRAGFAECRMLAVD
jgi:hypothetical protein